MILCRFLIVATLCFLLLFSVSLASDLTTIIDTLVSIHSIAWNPEGTLYAVGGGSHVCNHNNRNSFDVVIMDGISHNIVQTLTGNECPITSVAWNNDGTRIASSNVEAYVIVWDTSGDKLERIATGPMVSSAYSVSWHPVNTGSVMAVDATGRGLIIELVYPLQGQLIGSMDSDISVLRWENAIDIIAGHEDGTVQRWNPETNGSVTTLHQNTDSIVDIEINHQHQLLAAASLDGQITIMDLANDEVIRRISVPTTYFTNDISWNPDATQIAVAGDRNIQIFDAITGQLIMSVIHEDFVFSVAWSPDGSQIIYGGNNLLSVIPIGIP